MAATMTATPNPVLINAGQTTGKTTIAWNGDIEGSCQVREVVGGVEIPVAPPALTGSITLDIGLGTHLYVLRRTAGGNSPVASVTVTVTAKAPIPKSGVVSVVEEALLNTPVIPIQAITRLSVTPQAD